MLAHVDNITTYETLTTAQTKIVVKPKNVSLIPRIFLVIYMESQQHEKNRNLLG